VKELEAEIVLLRSYKDLSSDQKKGPEFEGTDYDSIKNQLSFLTKQNAELVKESQASKKIIAGQSKALARED
jgi:hypothetical protein